jgi:hypothetical protein
MFLIDQSAWTRFTDPAIPEDRFAWLAEYVEHRALGTCLPFLLEAGYSARSARHYDELFARLDDLPRFRVTEEVEDLALDAQQELARVGHHRVPPPDLMIAACAHAASAGVLHYDKHYDVIREHTSLRFDSEWLMPAGTL